MLLQYLELVKILYNCVGVRSRIFIRQKGVNAVGVLGRYPVGKFDNCSDISGIAELKTIESLNKR